MIEPTTVLKGKTFSNEKGDGASILLLHCTALNKCSSNTGQLLNFTTIFFNNQQVSSLNSLTAMILAKVLELNLELAEKEKRGEPVVGPCAQLTKNTNRSDRKFGRSAYNHINC